MKYKFQGEPYLTPPVDRVSRNSILVSRFQIAIDVKTIIIEPIFIQT